MLTPEVFGLLVFTTLKETWKVLTPEFFGPLVLPGIYTLKETWKVLTPEVFDFDNSLQLSRGTFDGLVATWKVLTPEVFDFDNSLQFSRGMFDGLVATWKGQSVFSCRLRSSLRVVSFVIFVLFSGSWWKRRAHRWLCVKVHSSASSPWKLSTVAMRKSSLICFFALEVVNCGYA